MYPPTVWQNCGLGLLLGQSCLCQGSHKRPPHCVAVQILSHLSSKSIKAQACHCSNTWNCLCKELCHIAMATQKDNGVRERRWSPSCVSRSPRTVFDKLVNKAGDPLEPTSGFGPCKSTLGPSVCFIPHACIYAFGTRVLWPAKIPNTLIKKINTQIPSTISQLDRVALDKRILGVCSNCDAVRMGTSWCRG